MNTINKRAARRAVAIGGVLAGLLVPIAGHTADFFSYNFGQLLDPVGGYQPPRTFAKMSIYTADNLTYRFQLTAVDLSVFGPNAYINKALFNTWTGNDPVNTALNTANGSNGVSDVVFISSVANTGGVSWDFGYCVAPCTKGPQQQLTNGEQVSWTSTFSSPQPSEFLQPPSVGINVTNFGSNITNGNTHGTYVPSVSPIPEPEIYALLLSGLGLLGFAARRKKLQASKP